MGSEDTANEMGFQHRSGDTILNCPSTGMNMNLIPDKAAGIAMSSNPFFCSSWDPLVSLSQSENFGASPVVPHSEFGNSPYSVVMENQGIHSTSHLVHFPSDSGLVEMVPRLPSFGSGSFSEMVGCFGLPEGGGRIASAGCPPNYTPNKEDGTEKASTNGAPSQISEEGAMGSSPCGKRKFRMPESNSPFNPSKNVDGEQQTDISGDGLEYPKEQEEKKQKTKQNASVNLRGKQTGKQAKDNSNSGETSKENYIHVRARRGQATNSHSLAERVRRERISERMRLLQELVPGCNKITGKAVMLDEIINYVQSLQQQVEFLSMKLASVNPELNVDIRSPSSLRTLAVEKIKAKLKLIRVFWKPMEKIRRASHAGSWYTDNPKELEEELDGWLRASGLLKSPDVRGVIAPHAGYSYSGCAAAYAFANIDPTSISRVFLLGPSHHYYTPKCALSRATIYKTPIGDLSIDLEVNEELKATGKFEFMDLRVDEAEHSMEMHLPYLAKVFRGYPVKIVPILVGAVNAENEAMYGRILAKYVDDPSNFFSVSSDFCHWGSRFNYTHYDKKHGPIHKSIEALDRMGMDVIETGDPDAFKQYLLEYDNTICGRHPISVFLHMLKNCSMKIKIKFLRYEQSSQCQTMRDSSVSYASAVAKVDA